MLDIAEAVFEIIAERLKQLNLSVLRAFGSNAQLVDQFESKDNVEIVAARDFLDGLQQLEINKLSELQIACLMRVLSRPELEHAIILNEL